MAWTLNSPSLAWKSCKNYFLQISQDSRLPFFNLERKGTISFYVYVEILVPYAVKMAWVILYKNLYLEPYCSTRIFFDHTITFKFNFDFVYIQVCLLTLVAFTVHVVTYDAINSVLVNLVRIKLESLLPTQHHIPFKWYTSCWSIRIFFSYHYQTQWALHYHVSYIPVCCNIQVFVITLIYMVLYALKLLVLCHKQARGV